MRYWIVGVAVIFFLAIPASALDFKAPNPPESAIAYMPDDTSNFGEGLAFVIREAVSKTQPEFTEAVSVCSVTVAVAVALGMLSCFTEKQDTIFHFAGTLITAIILLQPTKSLIRLSTQTITEISQYGKMLLPVMTAALTAQGGITRSAAIYTAAAFFDTLLSSLIAEILMPFVYVYLCLTISSRAFPGQILLEMKKFLKWLITWGLKIILYVFTGYLSITGIVAGSTDASVLKATKLTISGMVPVVGGILSDASEAVLVSAGLVKNTVGIYGLLVIAAMWIGPFLKIGLQYVCLKMTGGLCHMLGTKSVGDVLNDFSETMGLLLAMIGAMCLIVLISTVCLMKGVG